MRRTVSKLALVVIMAAGCSASPDQNSGQDSTPSSTADPVVFAGAGYELDVPADWIVNERLIDWTMGTEPHRGSPPFDTFSSPNGDPWLLVGDQPVSPATTLDRWVSKLRATNTITYPTYCEPPEREHSSSLGGESALSVWIRCPDDVPLGVGVEIMTVHDGSGFLVLCYSEEEAQGDPAALEADCTRWMSGFRFTT